MVRLAGDDKANFTVWFDLRQRTLHAETQLLPAPEENPGPLYEYLLRANEALRGVAVSIGPEDACVPAGGAAGGVARRPAPRPTPGPALRGDRAPVPPGRAPGLRLPRHPSTTEVTLILHR